MPTGPRGRPPRGRGSPRARRRRRSVGVIPDPVARRGPSPAAGRARAGPARGTQIAPGTRRGDGIPRGWPVVAGIPRRYILRPQRDPDAREALDRPMAVRLAQRMLAVPGLLEQSRQGLRRLTGDVEPLDGEALELPRGEGALGGDPARAEQRA